MSINDIKHMPIQERMQLMEALWDSFVHDDEAGQWWRSYGNENWEFDENGLMMVRHASINDLAIKQSERKLTWDGDERPDDWAGLSEMGL